MKTWKQKIAECKEDISNNARLRKRYAGRREYTHEGEYFCAELSKQLRLELAIMKCCAKMQGKRI